jgi:Phosphotransferase enzyme family
MDEPVPSVDYATTAQRPSWDQLPAEIPVLVRDLCGTPVAAAAAPSMGGFTNGYAGFVELANGDEVFVKAGGPVNEHVVPSYRQEAAVVPLLPAGVPVPRLLATGETEAQDGTWRVLISSPIRGRMPQPWTESDLAAVHSSCLACAALLTPGPATLTLPTLVDQIFGDGDVTSYFTRLARGEVDMTWGQPTWVQHRADELASLTASVREALRGTTANHSDLRADNVVIDADDKAWLVDWNWLSIGPAWTDFVGVLPLARADGLDADDWLRRSPLTSHVAHEDIDTWLAGVAAYMLVNADRPLWPGGTETIRVHQRRYARTFLDWLGERRGWAG